MSALDNVQVVAPEHLTIKAPAELRELRGWLIWNFKKDPENPKGKPLKVPYYPEGGVRSGKNGSPEDREQLTTFSEACRAAAKRGFDGIGLGLMPEFGITALDFDNVVDADGKLPPEVREIASQTYAEFSPSGKGIRAFVRGSYGNHKSPTVGNPYGFETFSSKSFVTFTGNMMPYTDILGLEDTIADLEHLVAPMCEARFKGSRNVAHDPDDFMAGREPKLDLTLGQMEDLVNALDPDMGREDWIKVGMALGHETEGDDTGFDIWNDWSSNGSKYPSEESLRTQWNSFKLTPGTRSVTMATVKMMAADAQKPLRAEDLSALWKDAADISPAQTGVMTPEGYAGKFPVYPAGHPSLNKRMEWFIKGVLPKSDLIVLYGASGSGKSFVAFDMAVAIARGVPWRGCRVKRAKVVFVVAEGASGLKNRVDAYCKHFDLNPTDIDIGFVLAAPNVLDNDDVSELAKSIKLSGADIFVIDTFAQVTPGANENSGEDMGNALRNLRTITEATRATALVIHHAGKDVSRGARGWSGIRAAADAEIEISVSNNVRLISLTKMKDGDDSKQWGFRLTTVGLGLDSDGDMMSSCVVEYEDPPRAKIAAPRQPKGGKQKLVLEKARALGAATPQGAPSAAIIDAAVNSMPYDPTLSEGSKKPRDQRRGNVVRCLSGLCEQEFLVTLGDRMFVPGFQPV